MGILYNVLILLHSWTRWAVVVFGIGALVLGLVGWFGRRSFSSTDNRFGSLFTISMDIQLLLGLLLYVGISPIMRTQVFPNFGGAMGDSQLRFWAVEHIALMLVAVVLAHVGRGRSRRATTDLAKHRNAAIFYALSIVAVLAAIPWPPMRPLFRFG